MTTPPSVNWSWDFIVLNDAMPTIEALDVLQRQSASRWIVIRHTQGTYGTYGTYLYAFLVAELLAWPALQRVRRLGYDLRTLPLGAALDLHAKYASETTLGPFTPPWIVLIRRPKSKSPSGKRYIWVNAVGAPLAVGAKSGYRVRVKTPQYFVISPQAMRDRAFSLSPRATRGIEAFSSGRWRAVAGVVGRTTGGIGGTAPRVMGGAGGRAPRVMGGAGWTAPRVMGGIGGTAPRVIGGTGWTAPRARGGTGRAVSLELEVPVRPPAAPKVVEIEDEGTAPVRYPSIETDVPPVPGAVVVFTIDLLRKTVEHTQGKVKVETLAEEWEKLKLSITLSCPTIDFDDDARGTVTIRRNGDSEVARIKGRVKADAPQGACMLVTAVFFHGMRFCGSAVRMFRLGTTKSARLLRPLSAGTYGMVGVEPGAVEPDVTVHIYKRDHQQHGGQLDWNVNTHRFEGLPPELDGTADIGNDPAIVAAEFFKRLDKLEPGKHLSLIEAFGSDLWKLAPQMFRNVYWALWDHYRRPLKIQFVTDESYLPWELMRPARANDSEIHPPLALKHPVGRWMRRYDGVMPNRLPSGRIYTIAPNYHTANRTLSHAQTEAQMLIDNFKAISIGGTLQAVEDLLVSTVPRPEPVAILHFAGHGKFNAEAATVSTIDLEDGELTSSEVARPEVVLGKICRALVFFNACEAGAAGNVFGQMGGWADAFLGRNFGGFIAPLWPVRDEDAGIVAAELLKGILQGEPIGETLRAVREKYSATSPSVYFYIYYGDVTAYMGAVACE